MSNSNTSHEPLIISIVTIVYNNSTYVEDAIQSVLSQSYPFIEYIVIDGGSTDGTIEIIKKYQERISIFLSEKDKGIYDALNKGVRIASGNIIGFLHSDDVFTDKNVVKKIAESLSNSNVDGIYSDLDYVKKNNINSIVRHWESSTFSLNKLNSGWMPPHPTLYLHRTLYEQIGLFDLRYPIAADYDFILRLFSAPNINFKYIPEVFVKMRVGGQSNNSIPNIIRKFRETRDILNGHGFNGNIITIVKFMRKLSSFILR
jgi:glycosyltransferase